MKIDLKGKLDQIFETHSAREDEIARRRLADKDATEEFRSAFRDAAEKVIKPALDELSNYLLGKQQRSRVIRTDEAMSSAGRELASVTLRLLFGDDHPYRDGIENAQLSFQADTTKRKVNVFRNTMRPGRGGQAGSIGTFPLESVTSDFIEEQAADWLAKVFGYPQQSA